MKRESMLECMSAMEDAMLRLKDRQDVWQNNIIYWLCRSVWLLLEHAIRSEPRGKK